MRALAAPRTGPWPVKLACVAPLRQLLARRSVARALDALRQLALFLAAYMLYRLVRGIVDGQAALAFENARRLINLERAAHLFFEPALQAWAAGQGWIVAAANWTYVNSHFTLTAAFLVWLYARRNHAFYYVRNMFMIAMGLALVLYVVFPTAPPRFLPEWGFTDTVTDQVGRAAAEGVALLYNPFAAVPSMHVAFALMIAGPAVRLVRRPLPRVAWTPYPVLVTFVVMVTGHHFWLDAAFGAAVAALSAYAAHTALARARPDDWSFGRGVGAEAPA